LATTALAQVHEQEGVVVQKIGASEMFIFPPDHEKTHIGTIKIGDSITIKYGIHATRTKARFIAFDSAKSGKIHPKLKTRTGNAQGFYVEDKRVPLLHIYIDPDLVKKVSVKTGSHKETMAREANMDVEFAKSPNGYIIIEKVRVY
jgi:hypothetical protein